MRTVKESVSGTGLALFPSSTSGDSLVLAPWAIDAFPPNNYYLDGPQKSYVEFDTAMDSTGSTESTVLPTGAVELYGGALPNWTTKHTFEYMLFPSYTGTGKVEIDGSQILSTGGLPSSARSIE
jgi:hypothetical protein